jgi:hypothetical protein
MADDWIDKLADKVHEQDAQASKDEQLRLHETQVISEKSRGFWEDLVAVVQRIYADSKRTFLSIRRESWNLIKSLRLVFGYPRPAVPVFRAMSNFIPKARELNSSTVGPVVMNPPQVMMPPHPGGQARSSCAWIRTTIYI